MELELGLKITRTREDVSSSVDFQLSKDKFGPLVMSQETDSRFIIIIHLKGFKKEGIEIDINKEGNRITVRGRKLVEEMVLIRWMSWKKETEFRSFKKAFRIPNIVDLDKIKARFDEDDATLTITMPKRVKGLSGFKIEEEDEEEEEEVREETVFPQEMADSSTESEDISLRKVSGIEDQEQDQEVMEKKVSQVETKSDDSGHGAVDETKEQEPHEQLNKTNKHDNGVRKLQGIEGPQRHNEESKIQDIVEGAIEEEKEKIVKTDMNNEDLKDDFVAKKGEGFAQNVDRTHVFGEDGIADIETKADEQESDKVDKIHKVVKKKEEQEENSKVRRKSKDLSLLKLQETEEQQSNGQKRHDKQEKAKEVVEEETLKAETNIANSTLKKVPEVVAKGEADSKMDQSFTPKTTEAETKAKEFESHKTEADEVGKLQEVVEKKEEEDEKAKFGTKSQDIILKRLQEIEGQQFQGQKRHDKKEKAKELVEAETNIEETENWPEEFKENIMEKRKNIDDGGARKVQEEIIKQNVSNEQKRSEEESKICKTNDQEKKVKEIAETGRKKHESYRPKVLKEKEKIQELADEKTNFSRNVDEESENTEKKTEFGDDDDDDMSRKNQDTDKLDSYAAKRRKENDKIQGLVLEEKVSDGGKRIMEVVKTTRENNNSRKGQDIDEKQSQEEEEKKHLAQDSFQETEEKVKTKDEEERDCGEIVERKTKTKDVSLKKVQDDEDKEMSKPYKIQEEYNIKELVGIETSAYREKLKKHKATDSKDEYNGGEGHNDHKEEQKKDKAELKIEEDGSKKVQDIEKHEYDEMRKPIVQDKMRETEETKTMQESEIVERVSLSKVQEQDSCEDWRQEDNEEIKDLVKDESTAHKNNQTEDSSQSQDAEEKGLHKEQEKIAEKGRKEEYDNVKREHKETSDQKKQENGEETVEKAEMIDECGSSRKIQQHEERKSDKLERLAKEETNGDKQENRESMASQEDGFGKVREIQELGIVVRHREQDKKKPFLENSISPKAKDNKNLLNCRDNSSRKTKETEKQVSQEQKKSEEQIKSRELRSRENLKDEEETAKKETKSKEIKEQEKQLVKNRTHSYKEKQNIETGCEDSSSKKFQETELIRDENRDKIQDDDDYDEEELEVEYEDSEEEWEAEVIQETDSNDDNEFRQIRRIKLGFRLLGGSTLFMSLIVIVISIIRSKRKIKCYKF
ncbi:unnamed protein product [Cochlearia groenlandica]